MLELVCRTRCSNLLRLLPVAICHSRRHQEGHRRFFSDDSIGRFQHVRDTLPPYKDQHEPYLPVFTTQPQTKEPPPPPSEDLKTSLKGIPLESIENALLQLVPENVKAGNTDDGYLTPGQAFYLENKDKLFENIRKRYQEETANTGEAPLTDSEIESLLPLLMEEEKFGSYDPDPVIPPSKHHLWDYATNDLYIPKKTIHLHKGKMPTLQEIVEILEQERMANIAVVDMADCNRRDQAMYCIVATGTTKSHCRRVGRMLYRVIADLEIPFVSSTSYCCNSRSDEWIIARLGPLCVHLMIQQVRDTHSIEELWEESRTAEAQKAEERLEDR